MRALTGNSSLGCALALVLATFVAGCGENQGQVTAEASSSAGPVDPGLGGRVDQVVKAAPGASASPRLGKADPNQPPPGGVFAPGVADLALAPGAPPKMELLDEGQDPKISIHASVPQGVERVNLVVAVLQQQPIFPPLLFALDIGPPGSAPAAPPAGSAAPTAAPLAAPSAAAAPAAGPLGPLPAGDHPLVATIADVTLGVPDPPKAALDLLRGTKIKFTMTKTGPTALSREYNGEVDSKVKDLLDLQIGALEDVLTGMYTPSPVKPVGQGAYWIVTDRRTTLGTDVVRYRVFKLTKVEGDQAVLSVQVRQYAANDKSFIAEQTEMENPVIVEYAATGEGAIQLGPGGRFPKAGQIKTEIVNSVVPFAAKGNPQARAAQIGLQLVGQIGALEPPKGKPGKDGKGKSQDKGPQPPRPKPKDPP
jgi:hypothetical protein